MKIKQSHLSMLKKLSNGTKELRSLTHGNDVSQMSGHYERYLQEMQALGLVVQLGDSWSLTNHGREKLQGEKKNVATAKIADWKEREVYRGEDLRDLANRPCAYDAFKLPSLMNGVRVYPKGVV